MKRRHFLLGSAAAALATTSGGALSAQPAASNSRADGPLKIDEVEVFELHGSYTEEGGVNRQTQVNPLDVYEQLRPAPYADKPSGPKQVHTSAVYVRIRTAGGIDGLYGPIEKSAALDIAATTSTGYARLWICECQDSLDAVGGSAENATAITPAPITMNRILPT